MNVEEVIKTDKKIPLKSRSIIHIILVGNKINEAFLQALKPFDVSVQQFNVMRILRGQNGQPANLCTLNERMITKMSNTTRLVDKLLSKGYVERVTCPSNRRKIEISITASGKKALMEMDGAIKNAEDHLVKNLSDPDLENLNGLLNKF